MTLESGAIGLVVFFIIAIIKKIIESIETESYKETNSSARLKEYFARKAEIDGKYLDSELRGILDEKKWYGTPEYYKKQKELNNLYEEFAIPGSKTFDEIQEKKRER